jgi:predicted amidohydrolase YtcJ
VSTRLITGATVWAGPACTPAQGWLLLDGDTVAGTGTAGPPSAAGEVLDLAGGHVLPGFVDAHLHLTQAAWYPHGGDAWGWRGLADALAAVRAAAAADPAAPWLLFWDAARWRWPEGRLPTARELDQAAPGRPVLVATADMHRGAVSPAGLAAAGLPARGGYGDDITRGRRGRPTGELWEAAFGVALQRALTDTQAHAGDRDGAVLAAEARRCLALGISHAHDPYVPPGWHQRMLALRSATPLRLSWATGPAAGMHSPAPGPGAAPDGPYGDSGREVKLFADGGDRCAIRLPSRAALGLLRGAVQQSARLRGLGPLREGLRRKLVVGPGHLHAPYLRYTDADLARLMAGYAGAAVRMRIHALGNLAGDQAARLLAQAGVPPALATIDHLMLLDPATADRVAATGAAVSYQPGFIPRYGDMLTGMRVDRYAAILGGRRLLQAGVPLVLSSDHPSGPLDPLANLRAAVDRSYPGGSSSPTRRSATQKPSARPPSPRPPPSAHPTPPGCSPASPPTWPSATATRSPLPPGSPRPGSPGRSRGRGERRAAANSLSCRVGALMRARGWRAGVSGGFGGLHSYLPGDGMPGA